MRVNEINIVGCWYFFVLKIVAIIIIIVFFITYMGCTFRKLYVTQTSQKL
jgi:hypothetical protein